MSGLLILQAGIIIITLAFIIVFVRDAIKHKDDIKGKDRYAALGVAGIITQFFDTLGIGSYSPLTAIFKMGKLVPDERIPGTLNTCTVVTCALMTLAYTTTIEVELITLFTLIIASSIGAFFGASVISKLPINTIRYGMGFALLIVVVLMLAGLLGFMPTGGEAIGLSTGKLVIAAIISMALGALMTIGIGIYAPMMALVYAMGLSPLVAFPIMMGSCAFLIPTAGFKFIKEGRYDRKSVIAVTLCGIIGVAIAVFLVKAMPLQLLKWLVICVITYTAIVMIRDAAKGSKIDKEATISKQEGTDSNIHIA